MQQRAPAQLVAVAQVPAPQAAAAPPPAEIALRPAQDLAEFGRRARSDRFGSDRRARADRRHAAGRRRRVRARCAPRQPAGRRALAVCRRRTRRDRHRPARRRRSACLPSFRRRSRIAGRRPNPDVAFVKPQADELGPIPEVIPLPTLSDRPVPVEGVPTPPRRPVGLAAAQPAPAQVASLDPVALPMSFGSLAATGARAAGRRAAASAASPGAETRRRRAKTRRRAARGRAARRPGRVRKQLPEHRQCARRRDRLRRRRQRHAGAAARSRSGSRAGRRIQARRGGLCAHLQARGRAGAVDEEGRKICALQDLSGLQMVGRILVRNRHSDYQSPEGFY